MIPGLPAGWFDTVNSTHQVRVVGALHSKANLAAPPDYFGIPIVGGSITTDQTSAYRTQGSVTVVDEDPRFQNMAARLTPREPGDVLTPYGTILRVMYGTRIPGYTGFFGDDVFYITLAYLRLSDVEVGSDGQIGVSGYDLSRTVSRNRFTTAYVIASGTLYTDAIPLMVQSRLPLNLQDWPTDVIPSTEVTPPIVIDPEQDPWERAQAMAAAIGYECWFGSDNSQFTLRPVADPAQKAVVAEYIAGKTALVSPRRRMSDEPGFNGVVLTAEATTLATPLRSEVWDDNADSPTYRLGVYGQVPYFGTTALAATQAQLDAAAQAKLYQVLGGTELVDVQISPNPALSEGDVIRLQHTREGIDAPYQIVRKTTPATASEAMTLNCQRVRATAIS